MDLDSSEKLHAPGSKTPLSPHLHPGKELRRPRKHLNGYEHHTELQHLFQVWSPRVHEASLPCQSSLPDVFDSESESKSGGSEWKRVGFRSISAVCRGSSGVSDLDTALGARLHTSLRHGWSHPFFTLVGSTLEFRGCMTAPNGCGFGALSAPRATFPCRSAVQKRRFRQPRHELAQILATGSKTP